MILSVIRALKNLRNTLPLRLNPHKTTLLHLPNELLLQITSEITSSCDLFLLLLINRRFYTIAAPILNDRFATKDKAGHTALQYAAHTGNEGLVRLLLDKGVDTEYWLCNPRSINPSTGYLDFRKARPALHIAVRSDPPNVLAILKLLLEGGACIDALDANGDTALWEAITSDKPAIVKFLLENGANHQIRERFKRNNRTMLHHAAENGGDVVVRLLLEHGADVNSGDNCKVTPLILAVLATLHEDIVLRYTGGRKMAVIEMLLDFGADLSSVDLKGRTPLHYAARMGDIGVIELLLEKGAKVDVLCAEGKSPLETVVNGDEDIARVLMR